jgi:hypothetical protein
VVTAVWKIASAISFAVCGKTPSCEISFSVGEIGKLLVDLLTENHSRANGRGQHILYGRLPLSLVSRRPARLFAQAQRDRRVH